MNALNIRKKYQRNMQLYMIVKQKAMIDKQIARAANGQQSSSITESNSITDNSYDSSFATDSQDQSSYVSHANVPGPGGYIHPNDMILEQSNDDDESFLN